jgi:hypothetical protein
VIRFFIVPESIVFIYEFEFPSHIIGNEFLYPDCVCIFILSPFFTVTSLLPSDVLLNTYLPSLEWLKCVGKDVFYGGLLMFCILCIIHYIVSTITFNMPLHIPFDFMRAFMIIVCFIVSGILISQSYFVIMKIKSKKKVSDLSEVS